MSQPATPEAKTPTPDAGASSVATANKVFEMLRAEISYEVNLITQRVGLFVTSQAFFFTSLSIALDRTSRTEFTLQNSLLFPLVPWVSLVVCVLTLIAVGSGFWSALRTRDRLISLKGASELAAYFPYRSWSVILGGILPSLGLPIVFGVAWLLILLRLA